MFSTSAHNGPSDRTECFNDYQFHSFSFGQVLSKLWEFEVESSILGSYTVVGGY